MTVSRSIASRTRLRRADIVHAVLNIDHQIEDLQEELEDAAALSQPMPKTDVEDDTDMSEPNAMNDSFMSESIYEKLPSPKTRRHKTISDFPMISSIPFSKLVHL
jgi:division protein 1